MERLVLTFAAIGGCGWLFFRVMAYIEGAPVLSKMVRRWSAFPVGGGIWLLNLLLMRQGAGFQPHFWGEIAGAFMLAALAAAIVSALGEGKIRWQTQKRANQLRKSIT